MKLISLNIWEGEIYQPLVDFLDKYKDETDIFCFQEIFRDEEGIRIKNSEKIATFNNIAGILRGFNGYFNDYVAPGDYGKEGLAMFLKKDISVKDKGEIFLYNPPEISITENDAKSLWRNLQYVFCGVNGKEFLVANMHGLFDLSTKTRKDDTPERIEQSRRIKEFLAKFSYPKILCGDFNLWPDTESMKILEEGMINLIKEGNITSTRSVFFDFPNKYADYILVSPEVKVGGFRVIPDIVSDHMALCLDFEI